MTSHSVSFRPLGSLSHAAITEGAVRSDLLLSLRG